MMKLMVRVSVLSLALAAAVAGVASTHSAKAQTVSHLAISAAMPAPVCEPGTPCKLHGR